MDITTLWDPLEPNKNKIEVIKLDIQDGIVPELPYFIIDQDDAKNKIGNAIERIDQYRMQTNLIIAQYGNGKTNLLKFIQNKYSKSTSVYVSYLRANVDQPDLFLFLLREFQSKYLELLIESVKNIRDNFGFDKLTDDGDSHFAEIKDFTNKLLCSDNSDDNIKEFIYLGTGRLYTKASFNKHHIEQLKDYNRREVFVLFLNILSKNGIHIIFEIDEVEKIREKSKIRFNHFLTSYRELIDLSNKIEGHYLLTSFTDSLGIQTINEANQALYTRIYKSIISLDKIDSKSSILSLCEKLNDLFATQKTRKALKSISVAIFKMNLTRNREIIQRISELILEQDEMKSLDELLSSKHLDKLYKEVEERLDIEGAFKTIHQKFFYPLSSFVKNKGYTDDEIKIQGNSAFIDRIGDKINYFIFKDDINDLSLVNIKVNELIDNEDKDIVIYSPEKLDLSYSHIIIDNHDHFDFQIVKYSPEALMVLFTMYRENFDKQIEISEVIRIYTKGNL